jgi:hypothetical protein
VTFISGWVLGGPVTAPAPKPPTAKIADAAELERAGIAHEE